MVGFSLSKKKKQLSFARHKFLDRIQKLQSRNYRHDLCLRIKRILTLDDNSTALGADERKKPPTEGAGNRNFLDHIVIRIQERLWIPGIKSIPGTTTGVLLPSACLLILEGRLPRRQGRPHFCVCALVLGPLLEVLAEMALPIILYQYHRSPM